jgi:hypothetical protein
MWSYYGRKTKVVKYYPAPLYDCIIEPFAGTAVYSLYKDNWKKDVILNDKYKLIMDLWAYLQICDYDTIMNLPELELRQDIRELNLPEQLKWLIGFYINQGSNKPKNIVQKWGARDWHRNRKYVADNIHKIKHWFLMSADYKDIYNFEATWFIDPPYQYGGEHYIENNIDYNELKEWILTRKGQVIVCENTKADWLDFKPLKEMHGQLHKTTEAIWINGEMT